MNNRIQKLAEQAGMYVDLDSKPWPKWMSVEESTAAYEKFAQLIVQECADFVAAGEFGDIGTANELKEYFGVES
jgi:hypothetical protein